MSKQPEEIQDRPLVDMKTHILTVASGIILEKGVKNTSLKDIAKTAGISKGTLYYYYSAKEDIIYDIAARNMRQVTDEIRSWLEHKDSATRPNAILAALFEKILKEEDRGRLHLYLLNDAATSNEKLAERFQTLYRDWLQMLKEVLDQLFPEDSAKADALSHLILAAMDGLMIQKICGVQQIPVQALIDLFLH